MYILFYFICLCVSLSMKGQNKGRVIPRVVDDSINYLEKVGLDTRGLFRRSVSRKTVWEVQRLFNEGMSTCYCVTYPTDGNLYSMSCMMVWN